MHEKFARQPIFDDKLEFSAYEILFRADSENVFRPYKKSKPTTISSKRSLSATPTSRDIFSVNARRSAPANSL
jgi:c-di-GMP-related signal transduction protein